MEISLALLLGNDSGLFEEVVVDVTPNRIPFEVKVDVHLLPTSRGIVVSGVLGVSECL